MSDDSIEAKLKEMGLELPAPFALPPDLKLPFAWIRVRGKRAVISGHLPLNLDGTVAEPLGKVGDTVSVEEGYNSARLVALSVLSSIKHEIGSLDKVAAWVRVFGMVNAAPGFTKLPQVINGFSDLIVELYGDDRGSHARSAVGMAELPFGIPVELEAEVELV